MNKIKVKAVPAKKITGESLGFRLIAQNQVMIPEQTLLERIAVKTGITASKGRFWMDGMRNVVFEALAANETVDCGFFFAKLYPTGTIPSMTAQPTKEANPVKARIFFKGAFAEKFAEIELVNETETINVIIYEIQQDGVSGLNRIESSTARIVMNLSRGKIDATQADNGIWLEDLKTGARVADAAISFSDSSTAYFTFPTLPASGKYRLVIATRDGESPDDYVLARATRNVEVVNGEVTHG